MTGTEGGRARMRSLHVALAAMLVFAFLPWGRAAAAIPHVWTAADWFDSVDTNPGDGFCDTNGDTADAGSDCTLRAAIMEANALDGPDEIELVPDEAYHLTIPNGTEDDGYADATGDLDVTTEIAIHGPGRGRSSVVGDNLFDVTGGTACGPHDGMDDRVFDVSPTGSGVFTGFRIEGGDATANNALGIANGGGVRVAGDLVLDAMGLGSAPLRQGCYSHRATVGGALFSSGNTLVRDSLVTHGLASAGGGLALADGGRVHINHSRVGGAARHSFNGSVDGRNHAMCAGGGIYNASTADLLKIHRRTTIVQNAVGNSTAASCLASGLGGGIYNQGPLIAHDLWIMRNTGSGGGGMWNEPLPAVGPDVLLSHVYFLRNEASGDGGGLANMGGHVFLESSNFGNNVAGGGGGGVRNSSTCASGGVLELSNVLFERNVAEGSAGSPDPIAGRGGGILNESAPDSCVLVADQPTIDMEQSTFGQNVAGTAGVAPGLGGGIYNGGIVDYQLGRMDDNTAEKTVAVLGKGGAIYNGGAGPFAASIALDEIRLGDDDDPNEASLGGGVYNDSHTGSNSNEVDVTDSSIAFNHAGQDGAGIYNNSGNVTVTNSTISSNVAASDGGGIYAIGDAPFAGSTSLDSVTVARNGLETPRKGDGIFQNGAHEVSLRNTIVAENPQPKPSGGHGNCRGTITPAGNNLDDDGTCGAEQSNVAAAGLGELALNGAPLTFTHSLAITSPAVDTGVETGCPATDQRGIARPKDGNKDGTARCDIGAYERDPADTDGDGLNDDVDHCDTAPGPDYFNGCPTFGDDHGPDGSGPSASPSPPPPPNQGGGGGGGAPPDADHDGIQDPNDNCRDAANADQVDSDGDGSGDACDADDDNDGAPDASDNCPSANPNQADLDGDGHGDACDADDDNDGAEDSSDNCPAIANADQADRDGDGIGDACDDDSGGGEPTEYETSTTLHFEGGKFFGSLGVFPNETARTPDRALGEPANDCGAGRHVGLYRVKRGSARFVARALTNAQYRFHQYQPKARGRFYARVEAAVTDAGTCLASQSRTIRVTRHSKH
jgi:thrombospondin type 3 repeat protein